MRYDDRSTERSTRFHRLFTARESREVFLSEREVDLGHDMWPYKESSSTKLFLFKLDFSPSRTIALSLLYRRELDYARKKSCLYNGPK